MTTTTLDNAIDPKVLLYDKDGKILLKESLEKLEAMGSATAAKKANRFPRATFGKKGVHDLSTNVVYDSQAAAAKALFPAEHDKNHFYIYEMYKLYPGRFAKIDNGVETVMGETPKAPTTSAPANEITPAPLA
jgi:hypothetical protein